MKNLEELGIIHGYRANVDYLKLGYEFMAIVHIYVEGDLLDVQQKIKSLKDVVAVFDVTGECDSIAWVACKNREEFSAVIKSMLTDQGRQEDQHLRRAEHDKGPIPVHARLRGVERRGTMKRQ